MSGDVRSLEEVIAAAELEWLASVKGSQSETRAEWIAAAVRGWCLAPQQIGWMAPRSKAFLPLSATEDEMAKTRLGWVPVYTMGAETL